MIFDAPLMKEKWILSNVCCVYAQFSFYLRLALLVRELNFFILSVTDVSAIIIIFNFIVSGCSNETPCQPGFLCSPHKKCIPAAGVITLFPNQLKDPQIISGTASLRVLRETKALEEDGKLISNFSIIIYILLLCQQYTVYLICIRSSINFKGK